MTNLRVYQTDDTFVVNGDKVRRIEADPDPAGGSGEHLLVVLRSAVGPGRAIRYPALRVEPTTDPLSGA